MEVNVVIENAKKIIELAKSEEWSEEELSQTIKLLHSHFESIQLL